MRFTKKSKISATSQSYKGFTLAEVLITLGVIGIVASLTIPTLMKDNQERQFVSAVLKFNSTLQQAVLLWKTDVCNGEEARLCLSSQNLSDSVAANFDQIKKYLKVVKDTGSSSDKSWLPDITYDYYGNSNNNQFGKVTKTFCGNGCFLLQDGTTFSMDVDANGFVLTVDVNGMKPPNRFGKDTFDFVIGVKSGKDIWYGPLDITVSNAAGQCSINSTCDPDNVNPTVGNGASLTSYVLMNHKLPDFNALSQTVSGFKP